MSTKELKNITITMIFDGSALNRDEKIGGNILSIKKLNVNGEIRSFIGKPAIRHYLFQTLCRAYGWTPAKVTGQGQVVQFDLTQSDILSSEELDIFGYMFTVGKKALVRKSPVGITKAVALFPYSGDLAFYANHDLVARGKTQGLKVTPNPFSKEEHMALYKVSFTLDCAVVGRDTWVVEEAGYKDGELWLVVSKPESVELDGVELKVDEDGSEYYEVSNKRIYVDERTFSVDEALMVRKPAEKNMEEHLLFAGKGKSRLHIYDFEYDEASNRYIFTLERPPRYVSEAKKLRIESGIVKIIPCLESPQKTQNGESLFCVYTNGKELGTISTKRLGTSGPDIVKFNLTDALKRHRIRQVVCSVAQGLVAHCSGEANTIIPLFLIAAPVKVPSPVFHPYIDVRKEDGQWKVIGVQDALKNLWIDGKVYIFDCERLRVREEDIKDSKVTRDWNELLKEIGIQDESKG